ncbi:MAG: Flp family type IVb pilin [Actinoallomurus sp.]
MQSLNPMNDPFVAYVWSSVQLRIQRLRDDTERSRGASAIEWAIITGLLAMIALAVGVIIVRKVKSAANDIKTK